MILKTNQVKNQFQKYQIKQKKVTDKATKTIENNNR